MTRQVLYSRASHEFLFTSEKDVRETLLLEREDIDPIAMIEEVTSGLQTAGMKLRELIHENDFTFVCFRVDGLRTAFTAGISEDRVSIPIVVIGGSKAAVAKLASEIRNVIAT